MCSTFQGIYKSIETLEDENEAKEKEKEEQL